jgi:hypothetical protein
MNLLARWCNPRRVVRAMSTLDDPIAGDDAARKRVTRTIRALPLAVGSPGVVAHEA